jgi:hypothetical protein
MVMASLGGIVESLLGIRITTPAPTSSPASFALLSTLTHDSRALSLRRLHVQVLSISNTISRLFIGLLSDWLSYAAEPIPEAELGEGWWGWWKRTFHRKPQVSRLAFLVAAGGMLAVAYAYVAVGLESTNGLWVLSVGALLLPSFLTARLQADKLTSSSSLRNSNGTFLRPRLHPLPRHRPSSLPHLRLRPQLGTPHLVLRPRRPPLHSPLWHPPRPRSKATAVRGLLWEGVL